MEINKIQQVSAYEVLDSRGNPTVAGEVVLESGHKAKAYVPSGASTGTHEALELRDGDMARYGGKGVLQAVQNVKKIAQKVVGMNAYDQKSIDIAMIELDGTPLKTVLGANAILAVSLAVARASALAKDQELYTYLTGMYHEYFGQSPTSIPQPSFNILNGGQHADSGIDVQEFMILPLFDNIQKNVQAGAEIYQTLKALLKSEKFTVAVGDEGGFAPKLSQNEDALIYIQQAIQKAGYTLGKDVGIALDVAASEFYNQESGMYELTCPPQIVDGQGLLDMYTTWIKKYSIISIEDPFFEDDFPSWKLMMSTLGEKLNIVGDDLLVTNVQRIRRAIDERLANAVLVKLNQIGSLYETFQAINLAHTNGMDCMISHRSGDTEDTFIADLGVATGCKFIKSGALSRAERIAKYNRLIEIDRDMDI